MKVIILAAGMGKRLRPLTLEKPKCMVSLGNKTLLEHQLKSLTGSNIPEKDINIVGGYKIECLEKYNINLINNTEYKSTNMVFSLFCAEQTMSDTDDLIISYGDIVYEKNIILKLLDSNYPVSIVADLNWNHLWNIRMEDPLLDAESFSYTKDLSITEIGDKIRKLDNVKAQYIGLIKIRKDYINKIKSLYNKMDRGINYDGNCFKNMYMTSFIRHMINQKLGVKACLVKSGWLEVDTCKDLETYHKLLQDNKLKQFYDF